MPATDQGDWQVKIIRSQRRQKSVSAQLKGGVLLVRAPATMSDKELAPIIARLRQRLKRAQRRAAADDGALQRAAERLNQLYFGGKLRWHSIRYVANQQKRFGSCTPSQGTMRISDRVSQMPAWVQDYVIVHELAHLLEANHGPSFWALVNRYPRAERARGYLMALGLETDEV